MTEIIPAILTGDMAEFERLLEAYKAAGATRVHIDVLDDTLIPGQTIRAADLVGKELGVDVDVHLMTAKPDFDVEAWSSLPETSRIIAHVESEANWDELLAMRDTHGLEVWAAINPDTPLEKIMQMEGYPDGAMFMTVTPGQQGNPFLPEALDRMQQFASAKPDVPLMVDGGVNPETAPQCVAAGASILVCGSYIAQSADPAAAFGELQRSLE